MVGVAVARYEYPGALYRVVNRGNYRSRIFDGDGSKLSFEKILFEAFGEKKGAIQLIFAL